ncbi:MAG: hypothetical protein HOV87_00380 [Catenulispora sp.]|nr:hypothetical protein [Catenulispora sp.]
MMRTLRTGVTFGLLLTASACASHPSGSANAGGPSTSSGGNVTGQSTSAASSGILPMPTAGPPTEPNQARPHSEAVNLRPIKWTKYEAGPGAQLQVHYTVGGLSQCNLLGRVDVVETATAVTVTVQVGQAPGADCGGVQPNIAASYVTTVTLRQPLGTRTVADGAS